ncbi:hypothetical protein P7H30_11905 [Streptococcus parauberis]|uniref:hypothetical protein n=1 Tax=Streptococcus parauberis TaxID=1348 RepID=UPI00289103F1|nr:hypothetical protein [Streptococcus parauberis]MDT2750394.1 hypothetical protein [Streptococcus parauberis]HEM9227816.1 hypothetical protein [Streptococcus agalactiae]
MSEDLKTIKELAEELGFIKQTIQYHVKFLPTKNRLKNSSGAIVLNLEEQRFIKNRLTKNRPNNDQKSTKEPTKNRPNNDQKSTKEPTKNRPKKDKEISINNVLLEQLKTKDEQIKSLVEAQKQTQNLLDQQQRLALQDKKLLDEYKSEINDLKALKMPTQDTKVEQVSSKQPQEVESVAEEPKKAPRKWWGLWRK